MLFSENLVDIFHSNFRCCEDVKNNKMAIFLNNKDNIEVYLWTKGIGLVKKGRHVTMNNFE